MIPNMHFRPLHQPPMFIPPKQFNSQIIIERISVWIDQSAVSTDKQWDMIIHFMRILVVRWTDKRTEIVSRRFEPSWVVNWNVSDASPAPSSVVLLPCLVNNDDNNKLPPLQVTNTISQGTRATATTRQPWNCICERRRNFRNPRYTSIGRVSFRGQDNSDQDRPKREANRSEEE